LNDIPPELKCLTVAERFFLPRARPEIKPTGGMILTGGNDEQKAVESASDDNNSDDEEDVHKKKAAKKRKLPLQSKNAPHQDGDAPPQGDDDPPQGDDDPPQGDGAKEPHAASLPPPQGDDAANAEKAKVMTSPSSNGVAKKSEATKSPPIEPSFPRAHYLKHVASGFNDVMCDLNNYPLALKVKMLEHLVVQPRPGCNDEDTKMTIRVTKTQLEKKLATISKDKWTDICGVLRDDVVANIVKLSDDERRQYDYVASHLWKGGKDGLWNFRIINPFKNDKMYLNGTAFMIELRCFEATIAHEICRNKDSREWDEKKKQFIFKVLTFEHSDQWKEVKRDLKIASLMIEWLLAMAKKAVVVELDTPGDVLEMEFGEELVDGSSYANFKYYVSTEFDLRKRVSDYFMFYPYDELSVLQMLDRTDGFRPPSYEYANWESFKGEDWNRDFIRGFPVSAYDSSEDDDNDDDDDDPDWSKRPKVRSKKPTPTTTPKTSRKPTPTTTPKTARKRKRPTSPRPKCDLSKFASPK